MKGQVKLYYTILSDVLGKIGSAPSLRDALDCMVRGASSAVGSDGCSLFLLDPSRKHLIPAAACGLSDWYQRKGLLDAEKSLAETLEGKVVSTTDAARDPRLQYPELAQQAGIASILSVPLIRKEQTIGELRIYSRKGQEFSDDQIEFLKTLARLATTVLSPFHAPYLPDTEPTARGHAAAEVEAETGKKLAVDLARPRAFAHPSEEEFAKLLDFYRIEWLYEPRSFPLGTGEAGVVEMFTPDFYLPELDTYIELTTLKQSLITEKNRKVRRLAELYPEVKVKLLNKKDYHRLLAKYGYGPFGEAKGQGVEQVLYSSSHIQTEVRQLGRQISQDYAGKDLLLVGVLKGMLCFMADLMRHISLPLEVDFMGISYYGSSDAGAVRITKDFDSDIAGQDVLMVEDIVDTGMTLNYVLNHLAGHKPASLKVCALLDKRARRLVDIPLDYVGFEAPDEFLVGYGLDYRGRYRNLPFIGILNPAVLTERKGKELPPQVAQKNKNPK